MTLSSPSSPEVVRLPHVLFPTVCTKKNFFLKIYLFIYFGLWWDFVWSAKLSIESVKNLNKYLGKSLLKVVVDI